MKNYKKAIENIRNILKNYLLINNIKSLVVGISGGIDSALCVALAKPVCDELGIKIIGRSITIESNKDSEKLRANLVGKSFCHDFKEIDLSNEFSLMSCVKDEISDSKPYKIRMGNIKARLRMIELYNLASKYNGMVLSTDNWTEYLLGFWSLHGDVGDYGMIQSLWKTEVYDMTEYICNKESNIAEKIALTLCINADATDGLGISNTDLDQILPDWEVRHTDTRGGYGEVDTILIDYSEMVDKLINNRSSSPIEHIKNAEKVMDIKDHPVIVRHMKSQFKRENPFNEKRDNYIVY